MRAAAMYVPSPLPVRGSTIQLDHAVRIISRTIAAADLAKIHPSAKHGKDPPLSIDVVFANDIEPRCRPAVNAKPADILFVELIKQSIVRALLQQSEKLVGPLDPMSAIDRKRESARLHTAGRYRCRS